VLVQSRPKFTFRRFTQFFCCLWLATIVGLSISNATPATTDSTSVVRKAGIANPDDIVLEGNFSIMSGNNGVSNYYLGYSQNGQDYNTPLIIDPTLLAQLGGSPNLRGQSVKVTGVKQPNRYGNLIVNVSSIEFESKLVPDPSQPLTGNKRFINIMCKFSDNRDEPVQPSHIYNVFNDPQYGLNQYFKEISVNQINLDNSRVEDWRIMGFPRSFYIKDLTGDGKEDVNFELLIWDCIWEFDRFTNFNEYYGINILVNGLLDSARAYGGVWRMTLDDTVRDWPFTVLSPEAYTIRTGNPGSGIATMAHEMGHAFGMDHSLGVDGQEGSNGYSVMSYSGAWCGPTEPLPVWHTQFGCLPQYPNTFNLKAPGWIPTTRIATFGYSEFVTYTLEPLARRASRSNTNKWMLRIPLISNLTYIVEAREPYGRDSKIPAANAGLVIHRTLGATEDERADTRLVASLTQVNQVYTIDMSSSVIKIHYLGIAANGGYRVAVQYYSVGF
jgi:M6 family metalloprotease-like protein